MKPLRLVSLGLFAVALFCARLAAAPHVLQSPNGQIAVTVDVAERVTFSVALEERPLVRDAVVSLHVGERKLGVNARVTGVETSATDQAIRLPVAIKSSTLREQYQELRLNLEGGAALVFRAYNEGVAYRWETRFPEAEVLVGGEALTLPFAGDYTVFYPEEQSLFSHNERLFLPRPMSEIGAKHLASIPIVIDAEFAKLFVSDADVEEYPGLWFVGTGGSGLQATFPAYPLEEKLTGDRDFAVTKTAPYLAKTKGTRSYPWRALGIVRRDAELLSNSLLYLLGSPSRIADPSWIKPGKVAWDWWNANNLTGVDFKTGINNATYQAFIDFAAENKIEYVVLDEGWYKLGNVLDVVPEIDVPALVAYGRRKNVGIILWVVWKTLDDQLKPALDQFAKWGVKGIKVDFMQRDDQLLMNYYHRVCQETAARRMLVDFHGGIRSALLTRTWPNLISVEGVRGNEWNKWSAHITPEHKVSLPFTRMIVGPMDFTPGATHNANRGGFSFNHYRPTSQGTRVNEMALYVVYESPLQMLCDTPSAYRQVPEMLQFIRTVPTTWDETKPLDGRISDFVVVARRHGADWYLGAITDWTGRELEVDLSFLPAGTYQLEEFRDGVNANTHAEDYQHRRSTVQSGSKLKVTLAEGGGWVARLKRE